MSQSLYCGKGRLTPKQLAVTENVEELRFMFETTRKGNCLTPAVETIMSSSLVVIHGLLRTTYANPDRYSLDLPRESRASFVSAFVSSTYYNTLEARRNATSTIKASGLATY